MNFWKRIFTAEILVMDSVTELPQYQEPEPAGHCSVCTTLPRLDHPLLLVRPQTGIGGVQNLHLVETELGWSCGLRTVLPSPDYVELVLTVPRTHR